MSAYGIVVTGAAGFIGSHVVEALLAQGETVVGVDDFNDWYSPLEKTRNLARALGHPRFSLVAGDIRDRSTVNDALARAHAGRVVHLAARAGVRPSLEDPALYADVNVTGTAVVLESCARAGVEHIVHASSSSVYGADSVAPFREDSPADRPVSPYAGTKRANEMQCWTHHLHTGQTVTCLRFFTAYGPRNRPDMAVRAFADRIVRGREITLYGTGTQRDFTYVGDIVEGVLAALRHPAGMLVCNLGHGSPVSVLEMVRILEALLGRRARIIEAALPPGDVPVTWADCSLAAERLGWRSHTLLEDGLAAFAAWYMSAGRAAVA